MSYAEHGSRIFFAGIDTQLQVDQKDGFGQRLKKIESCSDIRAWSSDSIENIRYFRETTEQRNDNGTTIVIPNMTLKETKNNDTEKDSGNFQKILKQDCYHGITINEDWNVMNYVFNPLHKLIFGESKPILTGIKKENNNHSLKLNHRKNFNFPKRITYDKNRKSMNNKTKSNTDISFSLSISSFPHEDKTNDFLSKKVQNKMNNIIVNNNNNDDDDDGDDDDKGDKNDDDNDINDNQLSDVFLESENSSTNEVESMIFALKPKNKESLKISDVELSQLRKENNQLRLCLKDQDCQIKNLNDDHQNINDLQKLLTQNHDELNELKNEVMNGRKIIDQLRKNLEEKKEECEIQNQQLNNLTRDTINIVSIKNERDSLANTLKEITNLLQNAGYYNQNLEQDIKNLLSNHKELIILKKNLELNCSENETEISKMYGFIEQIHKQNENQTMIINKLNKDIEQKTNLLNQYEEKITLLAKQCQEKLEIEKSFHENESINKDCDQAFAKYFKQSLEKLNDLTNDLKDAGYVVQKRKRDINKLKNQMKENIKIFKDQFKRKNKENKFYRFRYEECQRIISQQIEDIENLKKVIDKLERKIIYKMELSVSELHQEHDNLTKKIQNLTSCIHERNMKIEKLENEKINLLNRIDHTSAQLEEQNQQVEVLKKMNSIFREKLDDRKKNIESIFSALQSIQFQIEKVHLVSLGDKKVTLNENYRNIVDISIVDSKNCLHKNSNNIVQDNIINMFNPTDSFDYKLSSIKNDINIISSDLHLNDDAKNSSDDLLIQVKEKSNSCENVYEKKIEIPEKINNQVNENNEEIKNDDMQKPNYQLNTISRKNEDFNFLSDQKNVIHRNCLKKQSHYYSEVLKSPCENNRFSKSLEFQSSDIKSDVLNGITVFSSKMKHIEQYICDDTHIIPKQHNYVKKKSNERSTIRKSEKFESSSCKQFILHCSEYLINGKNR